MLTSDGGKLQLHAAVGVMGARGKVEEDQRSWWQLQAARVESVGRYKRIQADRCCQTHSDGAHCWIGFHKLE